MKRIKDEFLKKLYSHISLAGKTVLEIGCGKGTRSLDLARVCQFLIGIDPSRSDIDIARAQQVENAIFREGSAEDLEFSDFTFDIVLYTLSFHHVSTIHMKQAIDESLRVLRPGGLIIFLEPGVSGSFFESEIEFDACDGDERQAKKDAYAAMMNHSNLLLLHEISDETIFQFDSPQDFVDSMSPKKNIQRIESFLSRHEYMLNAELRINIFQAR